MTFNKPTVYMSHPIRGSNNDFEGNCKKAIKAAERLRRVFPEVDFYVPAEHDLFVQIAWKLRFLDEDEILEIDCRIIEKCHAWMCYEFDESRGCDVEYEYAGWLGYNTNNRVTFDIEKANYDIIRKEFADVVKEAKKRFRERSKYATTA